VVLEEFLFAVHDPYGRLVVFTRERLEHIERRHPELARAGLMHRLKATIERPEEIHHGRSAGEEWFYARGGPSRWLKVVVRYDRHQTGRIITAFPRRSRP
jgi:hypothetical protein